MVIVLVAAAVSLLHTAMSTGDNGSGAFNQPASNNNASFSVRQFKDTGANGSLDTVNTIGNVVAGALCVTTVVLLAAVIYNIKKLKRRVHTNSDATEQRKRQRPAEHEEDDRTQGQASVTGRHVHGHVTFAIPSVTDNARNSPGTTTQAST